MTPIKRPLASAGAAVLFALSLSACGGGAPTDASKEDFCDVVNSDESEEEFNKAFADKDWGKMVELVKEQGEKVEEVGTPEDIPDDARKGYELQLEQVESLSEEDLEKAFKDQKDPFEADLSSAEKKDLKAYNDYQSKTCS
jgi:hypothetical protein